MTATEPPPPPPEAVLVRRAREARGISPEVAAARTPIRLGGNRWRQIENGYERLTPAVKLVKANPKTLAHMATVVGLDPTQLIEAGREDAAAIQHEILRTSSREAKAGGEPSAAPHETITITLSEMVRTRRDALGLTVEEVVARAIDPDGDTVASAWTVESLNALEADSDPRPPKVSELRGLRSALALPLWKLQDATSFQFYNQTVVWHSSGDARMYVADWPALTPERQEELRNALDAWLAERQ